LYETTFHSHTEQMKENCRDIWDSQGGEEEEVAIQP
jgi:hypothetical protein